MVPWCSRMSSRTLFQQVLYCTIHLPCMMIRKISRGRCLSTWKKMPYSFNAGDELFYPDIYESYILTIASKSAKGHAKAISTGIYNLLNSMGCGSLIFMGDTTTPWLYQHNNYPPVNAALGFIRQQKAGDTYNGAFMVSLESLPEFLVHLFWLVRCNASLPVIYGLDEGEHLLLNFCQYGNLHLSTLDKKTDSALHRSLPQSGLHLFTDGYCYESFSKKGRVSGRGLVV